MRFLYTIYKWLVEKATLENVQLRFQWWISQNLPNCTFSCCTNIHWKLGTWNLAFTNNHQHGSYKLFPTLYFQETTSNTHLYMHHVADLHVCKCISFWWQFKHYCRYTDIPNVPITYPVGIHRPTWPNRVGVVAKLVIMIIVMMVYRYNQQSMHKGKNLQGSFKN